MANRYLIVYENGRFYEKEHLDFSLLDKAKADKVNVHFRFKTETKKPYSEIELYDENGSLVDSCFVSHKWENVNAEAFAYTQEGERFAVLCLQNEEDERYFLKEITFEESVGELFDGGVLYQIGPKGVQMMGYVYATNQGEVLAFDGGNKEDKDELKRIIQKHGGGVHHWVITHYHSDHIGAIIDLFEENAVKVENIYFDFPATELLGDRGDRDNYLVDVWRSVLPKQTRVVTPKKGGRYALNGAVVTVLNDAAFDVLHDFSNNSSVVYKLDTGKTKVLFTGDLERKGEELLEDDWFRKELSECSVVQMSHHGQKGVSRNFYDATAVQICLYPTPLWLWNNNNGGGKNSSTWTIFQTREWMRERNVKKSYTSIENKTIEIY